MRAALASGRNAARRFVALERVEREMLLRAFAAFAIVEVGLRILRFGELARLLGVVTEASRVETDPSASPTEVPRAVAAADRLFRRLPPRGRCLRRSLVLAMLLRGHGAVVRFGACKSHGVVAAHAWVELAGEPIPDIGGSGHSAFTRLS